MTVKKVGYEGYIVSDIILGHLCEMRYLYYSKKEAIELFKEKYKEEYTLERENLLDKDFIK